MKNILLLTLLFATSAQAFELLVTGLRNNEGSVRCSVYKTADAFLEPKSALVTLTVKPVEGKALCDFKELAEGDYALGVLHDEDQDTLMRTNFIGLPREGWAVSNDAPPRMFGAPTFESALKSWKTGERAEVKIRY
jgi:uncharacterized protein (DUF2141 family)